MKAVTVRAHSWLPRGQVFVMANTDHPELPVVLPIDEAEHVVIVCHPSDERAVRDALAVEQERPKWWRDEQERRRVFDALARAMLG